MASAASGGAVSRAPLVPSFRDTHLNDWAVLFTSPCSFLSMATPTPFELTLPLPDADSFPYRTPMQAFQHYKARLFQDEHSAARLLVADDPSTALRLGRAVTRFDAAVWREQCVEAAYVVQLAKFEQHPQYAEALLATQSRLLVHCAHHSRWGVDWRADAKAAPRRWAAGAENVLGEVLMRVRSELQSRQKTAAEQVADMAGLGRDKKGRHGRNWVREAHAQESEYFYAEEDIAQAERRRELMRNEMR